jgi:predicted GNAT family acetyltransferase
LENYQAMEIQFKIDDSGKGAFFIEEDGKRIAEMVISISGNNLTVYHTEVSESLKGKGVSTQLLETMVKYVRDNNLKVIPLCPYVNVQFRRHPDKYGDIWNKEWHS